MTVLTFLGHSACLIEGSDSCVIVDPFLTGNPAATTTAADITCTHVALTHGHEDHIGDTIAIAKANDATIVAAYEICNWAGEQGHENVSPGNPGVASSYSAGRSWGGADVRAQQFQPHRPSGEALSSRSRRPAGRGSRHQADLRLCRAGDERRRQP